MDYDAALAEVYEHLNKDDVEKAVMVCLRIARSANDYLNAAVFFRELSPKKEEFARMVYNDTRHLNDEAKKFLFETSLNRWLEVHTLDFSLSLEDDDRKVLATPPGEIDAELDQLERSIADMALPAGMHPFDMAAFTDRFANQKAGLRLRIKALQIIKSRLKARCLNYATQVERQFELQRKNQGFLESVQNEVNNFFKARSEDVSVKLQKAAQLAASRELEDASLLLTEVRRAVKAAADYFYPPTPDKVICADGKERVLGDDHYLNRLDEFIARRLTRSTSKDLLNAELNQLTIYVRRLNDMASKGVHASVTLEEARQGLVGLYFFLFNICQHLTRA